MKYFIYVLFSIFFVCATVHADHLSSDPSPDNATHWGVVLDNGTEYNGTTVNGTVYWNIDSLPEGNTTGTAHFGDNSTSDNSTNWSIGTGFTIKREGNQFELLGREFIFKIIFGFGHSRFRLDKNSKTKIKIE